MHTKESLYQELRAVFVDFFELDETKVVPEASLYEHLGLDSIDAIDMIIKLQEITGKKVEPEKFKSVRTVQDVVDVVYESLQS